MTHQIAKLPLRVYTPIPDLEYNEKVEDDILELGRMLNVNVESMRSLSPVSCQAHEPHESLRTVPWVKTPHKVDGRDVDPNVAIYQNGLWVDAVPQFETLAATKTEIEDLITNVIDANDTDIDVEVADALTARDNVLALNRSTKADAVDTYENMIKTRQYVSHDRVLYGVETCVIEPGTGHFDPVSVSPHSTVNFVIDSFEQTLPVDPITGELTVIRDTENPLVPWGSPVYRTYCHPQWFLGGGYDEQDWDKVPSDYFLQNLSYRSRWTKWEWMRRKIWEGRLSKIEGLPPQERYRRWVSPYTAYPAFDVGDTGWVHFARHFGFDGPPVVVINITSDILEGEEGHGSPSGGAPPASDPSNWIRPYVWIWEEDPADGDAVLGFYVWFENFSYSPGGISNRKRTITYTWAAYGQRKVPTEIWT